MKVAREAERRRRRRQLHLLLLFFSLILILVRMLRLLLVASVAARRVAQEVRVLHDTLWESIVCVVRTTVIGDRRHGD